MFIDSHTHIDGPEFDADRNEVVQRARDANVNIILNVGTGDPNSGDLERAVALTSQYEGVYAAVGTHPHDARLYDEAAEERIGRLIAANDRVLAWGEIGLDFHYDNSPRLVQIEVFRRQLKAAINLDVPVIVHTRDADVATIEILTMASSGNLRGVVHCFTGSEWLAQKAVALGMLISFSGILTFKKSEELREIARQVPLNNLLIETDCPFLAPVPYRGQRNEPALVVEVAKCLADLHGLSIDELARITGENFARLFGLTLQI